MDPTFSIANKPHFMKTKTKKRKENFFKQKSNPNTHFLPSPRQCQKTNR